MNLNSFSMDDIKNKVKSKTTLVVKNIKDMANDELFQMIDEAGNSNGYIEHEEFKNLCDLLGVNLNDHRIRLIFSKVKLQKGNQTQNEKLNRKEFDLAMKQIDEHRILQTLETLGVSYNELYVGFIYMAVVLLIFIIFLFIGI